LTPGFPAFRALLVSWLEHSSLFPDKNLHIDLILNPEAGAFRHRWKLQGLVEALHQAGHGLPPPLWSDRKVKVSTWTTEYSGQERVILAHLQATDPTGPGDQRLIVVAGGDGTSRGALISALDLPLEIREGLLFFRLPLGTGNDSAETRDWARALEALSGRGTQTVEPRPLPVLEVQALGHPLHFSFNIASLGLDAFVAHLTNRLKGWFPGNSYGLMVDAASFFYEAFVRVAPTMIELRNQGKIVLKWDEGILLAAMGVSGHRTYGAGKKVLPDDDNFCMAGKKSLFSKLAYRKPFYTGTHRGLSGVVLARGDALRIDSRVRVPMQMDGEVLWLDPENFPLTMTVREKGLRVLALAGNSSSP